MFRREESVAGAGGETVIARGVKVEGDFTSNGDVVIEGEVEGTLTIVGDLRVGEQAKIQANVKAKNAHISGEIVGNISVAEKLDLSESSRVTGDIEAGDLQVASGAQMNGRVSMNQTGKKKAEPTIEAEEE